jgi:CRP-like cAMP-binding protein
VTPTAGPGYPGDPGGGEALSEIWHLRSVDWLSELPSEDLEKLRAASSHRDYQRGETVFAPNPDPASVYLLERGLVRIYRLSPDGAETTFGYVAAGEVFGELTAFGDFPRESFAAAVRASRIWRIRANAFREIVAARPEIAVEITRQMGHRLKRVESRVENLVFRNVRSRLAHVLLELAADLGSEDRGVTVISEELTQSELATLVGSTRQSVNVALRELQADGLIAARGRRIALRDPAGLARIARPGPAS